MSYGSSSAPSSLDLRKKALLRHIQRKSSAKGLTISLRRPTQNSLGMGEHVIQSPLPNLDRQGDGQRPVGRDLDINRVTRCNAIEILKRL